MNTERLEVDGFILRLDGTETPEDIEEARRNMAATAHRKYQRDMALRMERLYG